MYDERNILIWLNSIGITSYNIEKIYHSLNDLKDLWHIDRNSLSSLNILDEKIIDKIFLNRNKYIFEDVFERIQNQGINVITILDEKYPKRLKNIKDKPVVLYSKGEYLPDDEISIAIVGSRKATAYGMWACEKFTRELSSLGITIVSGLALGIDAIAHKTAIENNGRTIALLGNGIDVIYPKNNQSLYNEIKNNGCIFTEFPMGTEPLNYNFPQRNRIISGLSLGVIVIEAKEKSGSLITATYAAEQGKDVFAVPGNINSIYSAGTNKLIKDGVIPLLDIDDILDEIYELKDKKINFKIENEDTASLSVDELKIVSLLKEGPLHSDLISLRTGMNTSTVISMLTILELKNIVKEQSGRVFAICY